MNQKQLDRMHSSTGFIAALDQSGGSTPKALLAYGVSKDKYVNDDQMFDLVHQMRTRIIKSPAFSSKKILGAILFQKTMERKIDDKYSADYLWDVKGIVPFLKIDKGLDVVKDGCQMMKPMPQLDELLDEANKYHIFGTKERSVIGEANEEGIKDVVEQQFEVAKRVIAKGLVPIIEPEVTITIKDKKEAEEILHKYLLLNLAKLADTDKVILKLSIPSKVNFYADLMKDKHVVRVVALSGGYSRSMACKLLSKNHGMIASFSRALAEGLLVSQTDEQFDKIIASSIDSIYQASIK